MLMMPIGSIINGNSTEWGRLFCRPFGLSKYPTNPENITRSLGFFP